MSPSLESQVLFLFRECNDLLTDGNVVVIVNGNQVAELEMASHGCSLAGNTLHSTTITEEREGVVVDQIKAGLVELSSGVRLGNGKTDSVGETLAERTGGDLNARCVVVCRMAGCFAVDLLSQSQRLRDRLTGFLTYAEGLEVVKGQAEAEQVEQGVLQKTGVSVTTQCYQLCNS